MVSVWADAAICWLLVAILFMNTLVWTPHLDLSMSAPKLHARNEKDASPLETLSKQITDGSEGFSQKRTSDMLEAHPLHFPFTTEENTNKAGDASKAVLQRVLPANTCTETHTHTYEHVFVYPSRGHALKLCSSCSFSAPHSRNNIWSYVCQPTRSISLNSIINITYSSGVSMSATVHAG